MVEIVEGERIAVDSTLDVVLLTELEQIAVADIRSRPYGGDVPPAHMHRTHAEAFYVVEGELELRLEDRVHRVGRDTWVLVPPEVVHTIVVTGEEPAHLLDLHVPGSGFGGYVRGLHAARDDEERRAVRAAFDQQPVPEYASGDPELVVIRRAGGAEGETITDRPGRRATVLLDAEELIISEFAYGPGERGAEPHVHHQHADGFLVVEGEFTFTLSDGPQAIPAGTFLFLPPDVIHGFDNESGSNARCFNFHAPSAGFGDYLRGKNPGFDQYDPPADGEEPGSAIAVRLSR